MLAMDKMKCNHIRFQELVGKLDEQVTTTINLLLSAHVKSGITLNPKSKDGLTHLHVACVVDHMEAVEYLLNANKELVNLSTNNDSRWLPGYTPLHYAVRYSSVNVAEILKRQGADINQKDAKGLSPLQLLVECLLDTSDFITVGKQEHCFLYDREIESLEAIIKSLLKSKINFIDDTGLSAFHVACTLKDKTLAEDLFKCNLDVNTQVNQNSKLWPGWTPLHFAACTSTEVMKLLLQNKAKVDIKNARGQTALDLCMTRFSPDIVNSILSIKTEFQNIQLTDGSTKLSDLLSIMSNEHELASFLRNSPDVNVGVSPDSPLWPGRSVLHLSVLANEKTKSPKDFDRTSGASRECDYYYASRYNCRQEDEAAYAARMKVCLEAGCSVTARDADDRTPIHLAFGLLKPDVVHELLEYCEVDNAADSNDLSVLHIASAVGATALVERLARKSIEELNRPARVGFEWPNSKGCLAKVRANSTALHVAVMFERYPVVLCVLDNGADVYAEDSLGLTPVHLSMSAAARRSIARELIRRTSHDRLSRDHLSHLHVAAFADDAEAVEELLRRGANVDVVFKADVPRFQPPTGEYYKLGILAGCTPMHVAMKWKCGNAVRALILGGADIHVEHAFRPHWTPLLALAEIVEQDFAGEFVKKLKRQNHLDTGAIAECGITLLHFACAKLDVEWARSLLEAGADPNARARGLTLDVSWAGFAALHVAMNCARYQRDRGRNRNFMRLVKLLLEHGANVTILNDDVATPVYSVYENVFPSALLRRGAGGEDRGEGGYEYDVKVDEAALFLIPAGDLMVASQKSYAVNPTCLDGFTHFHYACVRNDIEVVGKFLDNEVDVNHSTDPLGHRNPGFTPLHFAVAHGCENVARLLIERGANVRAEDSRGNTPLHVAARIVLANVRIIQLLLSYGANINAVNLNKLSPVDLLIDREYFTFQQLELFLRHGSTIDVTGSSDYLGRALKNAVPRDHQAVFEALVESCDLKKAVEKGFNAVGNIVAIKQIGQLTFEFYLEAIQRLIEMGYDIDQQDDEGETALHKAAFRFNVEAVEALLALGADVNVVNDDEECPLNYRVMQDANVGYSRDIDATTIMAQYLWKMKFVGLGLSEANDYALSEAEDLDFLGDLSSLESSCESELAKMMDVEIDQSFNVKDFLVKINAKPDYLKISPARYRAVDGFFKRKGEVRREFPVLGGLLMAQYNTLEKARIRKELLVEAQKSLVSLCEVQLPELCLEFVLQYLVNRDLKLLIDASKSCSELRN